ncbi:MAG: histidine kinase [Brevundimonas sp.]|uniref:sensor histidine kinase n=1 Tax=Brevundimonas sp. TaxID=1871086 RepID=UPI0017BA66DA|nr:HWE histidine kinase domain-containing protein [Brevundimonas sp.]MBA4805453.1 histidine kinase [Brevundimonas sp.]
MANGGNPRSVRSILVLFALCIVLPATLAIGGLVAWNVQEMRRSQEAELLAIARSASKTVDLRMAKYATAASAIATSIPVLAGDWTATRERVDRLELGDTAWVVITDRAGRRLLNTNPAVPADPVVRLPRPASIQAALQSPDPVISDLFTGSSTGRKVVAVEHAVPDSPEDRVVSLVIDPVGLLPTPSELPVPSAAFTTLVDRRYHIVARSRNHVRWQGASATPNMRAAMSRSAEGVTASRSLDGEPTVVAYTRSDLTGWTTLVVIPREAFLQPVWRNGIAFGLVAAALLLLGAGLARGFGNGLIRELRALEDDAERLGHGEFVAIRTSRIDNIGRVQAALSAASAELRSRASRQQLMINELNHRVKNTLATVQGIAVQTFRHGDADAPSKFDHRLGALAGAHDLLTQTSWEPVDIRSVVDRCGEPAAGGIAASGPSVMLPPHAALALCMCLHELVTNSLKYGALSVPGGKILLSWTLIPEAGEIDFLWREQGGPPARPPERKGFGTRLVDRLVRNELGGSLERDFGPDGLEIRARLAPPEHKRWRNTFD